jgi:hypothetical protein
MPNRSCGPAGRCSAEGRGTPSWRGASGSVLENAVRTIAEQAVKADERRGELPVEGDHPVTVHAKMLRLELLNVRPTSTQAEDFSLNCSKCGLDVHWVSGLGVMPGHWAHREPAPHGEPASGRLEPPSAVRGQRLIPPPAWRLAETQTTIVPTITTPALTSMDQKPPSPPNPEAWTRSRSASTPSHGDGDQDRGVRRRS